VVCLGAALKALVRNLRNSRAIRVMELPIEQGAKVSYSDPPLPSLSLGEDKGQKGTEGLISAMTSVVGLPRQALNGPLHHRPSPGVINWPLSCTSRNVHRSAAVSDVGLGKRVDDAYAATATRLLTSWSSD
jgi:hypothetical protein